ncbi:MAG TPA: MEDS domain-containing protein, partial [Nitrospira sp.]|nr:MEDS domain-containing protein [Nitrospira sp.]
EVLKGTLILSSGDGHLLNGGFDIDRMLGSLNDAVSLAVAEGYQGLWATGDMSWEFGPKRDFSKLLEYEWGLEELFEKQQALSGICQYHTDTLPRAMVRQGLLTHRGIFINETLSRLNSHYVRRESFTTPLQAPADIDNTIDRLCNGQGQA